MLKDDAVPTVFAHNKDKQYSKRKTSVAREQQASKKQVREAANI